MLSNTERSNTRINRNYQLDLFTMIERLFFIQQHIHYRQWKALESWSDQMIKDLSYVSRMEEFNHNKVIVKDSKKNEWLWFIIRVSGSIPLFKQPKQDKLMFYSFLYFENTEITHFRLYGTITFLVLWILLL